MLSIAAVSLAFLLTVDALESDTFGVFVVQDFDGVAFEDEDDGAGEIFRDSGTGEQEREESGPDGDHDTSGKQALRAVARRPLPTLLMDEDSIEGKLPRPDERNSNETVEMTVANILWGYGGLVRGHEKTPPSFVSL